MGSNHLCPLKSLIALFLVALNYYLVLLQSWYIALIKFLAKFVIFNIFEHLTMAYDFLCLCLKNVNISKIHSGLHCTDNEIFR